MLWVMTKKKKLMTMMMATEDGCVDEGSAQCEFCSCLNGDGACPVAEVVEDDHRSETACHARKEQIVKKKMQEPQKKKRKKDPKKAKKKKVVPLDLLHRRMGHYNVKYLKYMHRNGDLDVEVTGSPHRFCCEACKKMKATRSNPPSSVKVLPLQRSLSTVM